MQRAYLQRFDAFLGSGLQGDRDRMLAGLLDVLCERSITLAVRPATHHRMVA